ncbi:MAG: helix-turn-helix domain-containing protein [Pseudomonas sp.]
MPLHPPELEASQARLRVAFVRCRGARLWPLAAFCERQLHALRVGYSNPSHFAHVFRKHTGLSPSDYRRQRQGSAGRR